MNKLISKLQAALKPLPPFKKVVVGVSGGMDSITLSHAFIQLGYEVIFAHLNHSYRGQASDSDERFVIQLGHKWGVPCFTKKVKISKKGNLENNSRQARYQFLEEVRKKTKSQIHRGSSSF